jgi:DNA-directed RNA polymerase specialized sigma24 family protein
MRETKASNSMRPVKGDEGPGVSRLPDPDGGGSQLGNIQRILAAQLPVIRARYHFDRWESEEHEDLARAIELVLAEMASYTSALTLGEWLLAQARRAVEERVVMELLRAGPTLGRLYCREVLAERIERYHERYWLKLPASLRSDHLRDAEGEMNARLATYTGTPALHRWMRQLAHREDAERGNIEYLDDWLEMIARLTVERFVVAEMLHNPETPLMRLNVIWVAQRVGRRHHVHCGEPSDPRASVEQIWSVLLARVPDRLHEAIRAHTDTVVMRILKGLPTFHFDSTLDTWRMAIVQRTMNSLLKRKGSVSVTAQVFSELARPDGGGEIEEYELALADDGLSLQERAEYAEWGQLLRRIFNEALAQLPETAEIIRLRLDGMKPRDVARQLDIEASVVHRAFHLFKLRVRHLSRERQGDDPDMLC